MVIEEDKLNIFNNLLNIMVQLRDPENGCEWDKSQDSYSIRKYCIEESYEVVDSIEKNDTTGLREELGDLLFQIIFHAQINKEKGNFDIFDIMYDLCKKMTRRHPHVFENNNKKKINKEEIITSWEKIKEKERIKDGKTGILADIPTAFPAITRSIKIQKRAAQNGFDWDNNQEVFNKIIEETEELNQAVNDGNDKNIDEEIGDLLFSIINLSRKLKIDPESSLRSTNKKFCDRISYIENKLEEVNKKFNETDLSILEDIWIESKDKIKQEVLLK